MAEASEADARRCGRDLCGAAVRTARALALLVAGLAVASAVSAQQQEGSPEWRDAEAFGRLMVDPGSERAYQILVFVPAPWDSRAKGVSAYGAGGEALYASPVFSNERMVGVEVGIPRSRKAADESGLSISLYLFESDTIPRPIPDEYRRPVSLKRIAAVLTTRPFTVAEMDRLAGRYAAARLYNVGVSGLGAVLDRAAWQQPPERRTAVMLWEGTLLLDEAESISFGGDADQVAWFVSVNGVPAADWRSGTPRPGGGRFGEPVDLAAGWHSIVFHVAQRHGEPIPSCLWRRPGAAPEGDAVGPVYPGVVATGWAARLKGADTRAGAAVSEVERYHFVDTGTDLMRLKCSPLGGNAAEDAPAFLVDGQPADIEGGVLLSTRVVLPEISVRGTGDLGPMRSPQYAWFPSPVLLSGSLRLGRIPPLSAHGESIRVTCHVNWPEDLPEDVRQRAAVVCVQIDSAGSVIDETPLTQSRSTAPAVAGVRVLDRTERISCRVHFGGSLLLPAADAVIVRPSDPEAAQITLQGTAAFHGRHRALLVCDPLPDTPWTAAPVITAGRGTTPQVVILDDFVAVSSGPEADLLPEAVANDGVAGRAHVRRLSVSASLAPGTATQVLTLASLPALLALNADAAVLAVGAGPLVAGLSPAETCLQVLFVAQCCEARGSVPVFVTLPSLPGVSAARSRSAALFIKEMSLNLGAGIVDLYASERRGVLGMRQFASQFAAADGSVGLSTPNNAGRSWFGTLLGEALAAMIHDPAGSPVRDASED